MTKYREILPLKSLGFRGGNIAQSCGVSRNTVAGVLKKATEMNSIVCPDGCVMFRLTAKPLENENFHKGGFWKEP